MPEYDIAKELARLHTLSGAAYSKQVERIARRGLFHPVEDEHNIFKGKSVISIKRSFILQNDFIRKFRKEYGK